MKKLATIWAAFVVAVIMLATIPAATQMPFVLQLANGSSVETARSLSITNAPTSQTLTARNLNGVQIAIEPGAWSVTSAPASGSQGSASIAAESGVRHILDCVSWSGASSGAVTAATGTLVIRDGASGAGTILQTFAIAHVTAAGAGVQTVPVTSVCNLNLVSTTNTAMTAEFSAGVTGEAQTVNISGWNVQ